MEKFELKQNGVVVAEVLLFESVKRTGYVPGQIQSRAQQCVELKLRDPAGSWTSLEMPAAEFFAWFRSFWPELAKRALSR